MGVLTRIANAVRGAQIGLKTDARIVQIISQNRAQSGSAFSFGSNLRYTEAVREGYKKLVWVYRCIDLLGRSVGSVPWKVYEVLPDDTERPLPRTHPLLRLINRPNPYEGRREFLAKWMMHLSLSGKAFWEVVPVQGKPHELWSIRPDWMKPKADKVLYIKGFELDVGQGDPIPFEPSEVMYFRYVDPLDDLDGMSPLEAARRTMAAENSAISWNQTIFDNSAVPSGVLSVPAQTLRKGNKDDIRASLNEEFTRENLNSPMILWGGMEWSQMGLSQRDMDFLSQRKVNKFEICGLYGVPPQLVGANENPTYSNYKIARVGFWEDTITDILDWLQGKFNAHLAPYFGSNIEVRYDLSSVPAMREVFSEKVTTAKDLIGMNVPLNAVNQRLNLGLDGYPWGDVAWIPATLVPTTAGTPSVPDDDEDADTDPYAVPEK